MPFKICPSCSKSLGPRKLECECGHKFTSSKKIKKTKTKNKKLKKLKTTPTKVITKEINPPKPKWKKKKKFRPLKVKWIELKKGNIILVRGGPYFVCKNGDKLRMAERGKFKVLRLLEQGILAFNRNKKEGGYAYLHCGPKEYCKETGIHRRPYIIKLLKESEDEI
jgi:hypothetical protein